jgi:sugar phosphate permease
VFVAAIMCAAAAVCIGLFSLLTPSDPLLLNATLIFVIGLCIAAPDSVLGGVGVTDACEQAGAGEGVLSSASGLVVRQR